MEFSTATKKNYFVMSQQTVTTAASRVIFALKCYLIIIIDAFSTIILEEY